MMKMKEEKGVSSRRMGWNGFAHDTTRHESSGVFLDDPKRYVAWISYCQCVEKSHTEQYQKRPYCVATTAGYGQTEVVPKGGNEQSRHHRLFVCFSDLRSFVVKTAKEWNALLMNSKFLVASSLV